MQNNYQWFSEARFGLFIHWGLYALPGGIWKDKETEYIGEWLQAKFRIPNAEYEKLAAQFNPVEFNAEQWVMTAKAAGMKYLIFTAKHHEGFAMYHSRCSPFNIVDATPFGRDVLAELVEACGKHDLKLGIYYSQDLDWHEPDGGDPGPEAQNFGMSWGNDWDFPDRSEKNFQRYFDEKVIPQLTELLTNYGPVCVFWFDCPLTISRANSERLVELIKKIQPECLINTRIGHNLGDYGSLSDNQLPADRQHKAAESPGTLNDTWGFKYNDHNWKTPRDVVSILAALASKDTNYLLNVGPGPDGRFPAEAVNILHEVGNWMKTHGGSIYGSTGNPFPYNFSWGWVTVSQGCPGTPTKLNLFLRESSADSLLLHGVKERIRRCYEPAHPDRPVAFIQTYNDSTRIDMVRINLRDLGDSLLPVIVLELDTEQYPAVEQRIIPQDGGFHLMPSRGQLHHGTIAAEAADSGMGPAGESYAGGKHSQVDKNGYLIDWHNPTDCIEWEIICNETGRYRIDLVTVSRVHSASWVGGQTVRITYEHGGHRSQLDAVLNQSVMDTATGCCYARGTVFAGELDVKQPGPAKISLTMLDPGGREALRMALQEVKLTMIQ